MNEKHKTDLDSWPFASIQHYVLSLRHEVTEVRIIRKNPYLIHQNGRREWSGRMISGYFNNAQMLEKAITPYLNDTDTEGIYVTLQECDSRLLARSANELKSVHKDDTTKDKDIVYWRFFPIDIDDPTRPSGISATIEEIKLARNRAIGIQEWFEQRSIPTIRAFSGNGYHVLIYLQAERVTEENTVLFKELGDRVNEYWKSDATIYNPARIFKLYGTYARKGSNTENRQHRCSRIKLPVDLSDIKIVTLDQLANVIQDELPLPETATEPLIVRNSSSQSNSKRFHGNTKEEWRTYAIEVLGIEDVSEWKGRGSYQLAHCTCPFCERTTVNAHITYNQNGAPGLRCHSNTCSGKSLEDLYQMKGIQRSESKPYVPLPKTYQKKTIKDAKMENDKVSVKPELERIKVILKYDKFSDLADEVEKISNTEINYYWYDIPCPYHADCVGCVRIKEKDGRILPFSAYWACETIPEFKQIKDEVSR